MGKEIFKGFATAHNWINVKDFLKNPKIELIETIDFEKDGLSKDLFKNISNEERMGASNYLIINNRIDEIIFKLLRENKELIKEYEYVVPSYFSFYEGCFRVTVDCFKKAKISEVN